MPQHGLDPIARNAPTPTTGPEQVADGIWRIALPLPFPPRAVNVYLLAGPDGWTLIDCGSGLPDAMAALHTGLAALGLGLSDITNLVLTHGHPDHVAAANDFAQAMGENGHIWHFGPGIDALFDRWSVRDPEDFRSWAELQSLAGVGAEEIAAGVTSLLRMTQMVRLPPRALVAPLFDGQAIELGGRVWDVMWTPGHASDHICLVAGDILLAGDHLLPDISPNVSLYPEQRANPMGDYLASLDRIAALNLTDPLVLPGHGAPYHALAERIDALRTGVQRRADKVLETVAATPAPATALAVMEQVFGGRFLSADNRRLALGETLAHLERLHFAGAMDRVVVAGIAHYHLRGAAW